MAEGRSPEQGEALAWVERVATVLSADGIPPIAGRIMGWLMICDPPEQSAGEISAAIGASRASLTTNIRMLTTMELVTRRTRPGERTVYYRVDDDAWYRVVQRQIAGVASYVEVAREGMDLLGPDSARAARVRESYEVLSWLVKVFAEAPPPPGKEGPS
ncbi:transcriptional regulator [Streptomonospora sp. PA3]|uniref:GbsR/MarR family transcriptional regulator n=1 Tax=Streptomonospora sp. PA3 TaxID=2607326 RepID=UPI0012DFD72F|nr:transcriptional regulator [Streptomonospora sp. PA3]MUL41949.1 transcriptional regulator [Streptomonospora sp. PA3]